MCQPFLGGVIAELLCLIVGLQLVFADLL